MSTKLKLYIVSILGVKSTYKDDQPKSLFCHVPIILEAKDINSAADQACTEAQKWFPEMSLPTVIFQSMQFRRSTIVACTTLRI